MPLARPGDGFLALMRFDAGLTGLFVGPPLALAPVLAADGLAGFALLAVFLALPTAAAGAGLALLLVLRPVILVFLAFFDGAAPAVAIFDTLAARPATVLLPRGRDAVFTPEAALERAVEVVLPLLAVAFTAALRAGFTIFWSFKRLIWRAFTDLTGNQAICVPVIPMQASQVK